MFFTSSSKFLLIEDKFLIVSCLISSFRPSEALRKSRKSFNFQFLYRFQANFGSENRVLCFSVFDFGESGSFSDKISDTRKGESDRVLLPGFLSLLLSLSSFGEFPSFPLFPLVLCLMASSNGSKSFLLNLGERASIKIFADDLSDFGESMTPYWTRGGGLRGLIWPQEKRSSAWEMVGLRKLPLKSKSKSSSSSNNTGVMKKEGVDGAVMKGEVQALSKLNSGAGNGVITSISIFTRSE